LRDPVDMMRPSAGELVLLADPADLSRSSPIRTPYLYAGGYDLVGGHHLCI